MSCDDRFEVIDALCRFAAGQDLRDPALLSSAFTRDAELDFVQPARQLGVELDVFRGRAEILGSIHAALAEVDTTHTVTNTRVELDGERASLFALVEAQHLPRADHSQNLLLKNFYWATLRRADGAWRIERMRISNAWYRGDPGVLFPKAAVS
jgi:hypothetical protein